MSVLEFESTCTLTECHAEYPSTPGNSCTVEYGLRNEAGNELFGISDASHVYRELLDLIHVSPELVRGFPNVNWGEPGLVVSRRGMARTYLSKRLLKLKYIILKDIVLDAVKSSSE